MKLRLIRHATLWLEYAGMKLLIDPMFSEMGVNPPIARSTNDRRNPLVPMPFSADAVTSLDAVLVTHRHRDHWDPAASDALDKSTPILCQPGDETAFASEGFTSVRKIEAKDQLEKITISRTSGRHGKCLIGKMMGQVSGFVLQAEGEPTVYIAGDTIWCGEVKHALDAYRPSITVVNAGGARFSKGDPITMNAEGVISLCRYAPYTQVAAVHMEAINHCLETREDLHNRLAAEQLLARVTIPKDGDWL